jgi:streptogramin lyase
VNSLGRLDPVSGRIEQSIPVGRTPIRVALGPGAVWVANRGDPSVWKIDPTSGQRLGIVGLAHAPTDLAVGGDGAVYVAEGFGGEVDRIDPRTLVPKRRNIGGSPQALAFGAGAVWVVDETNARLLRLSPSSLITTGKISIGGDPVAVAADAGSVWVADAQNDRLVRVNPRTMSSGGSVALRSPPGQIATGAGRVWVTSPEANAVYLVSNGG